MIKKSIFIVAVIFLAAFSSCKKGLTVNFDVKDSEEFTIPPNSILTLPPIITPPVSTNNWSGSYSNNNTDKNHVQSCKLTNLTLTIKSPQGKTFGFVKSIHVYIQSSNLPTTEIAYIDNNPTTAGGTITLIPDDVDLTSFVKADSFTLSIQTTLQENNGDNVDVQSDMTLHVVASVL